MLILATVKKWLSLLSLMMFLVVSSTAGTSDFLGVKEEVAAKGGVQYTKSSLSLGRQMHSAYKAGLDDGINTIKEFRLPSGKRIDFLDIPNRTIFELKPFNPRAMQQGQRQLNMYMQELQTMPRFQGIQWRTVLDTY